LINTISTEREAKHLHSAQLLFKNILRIADKFSDSVNLTLLYGDK